MFNVNLIFNGRLLLISDQFSPLGVNSSIHLDMLLEQTKVFPPTHACTVIDAPLIKHVVVPPYDDF